LLDCLNELWEYKLNAAAKKSQTINFTAPASPVTYGAKPVALKASASSGLAVSFKVLSGPGKLTGGMLTVSGAGTIVVAANQIGNSTYSAAPQVTHSILVNKAALTATADNLTMKYGAAVPTLTYSLNGFVNGDTAAKAVTGKPALSTTATSKSAPGSYLVQMAAGTLAAANYSFTWKNGTLTVQPLGTAVAPVFSLKAGAYKGSQKLTITDATKGAAIYYTTDSSSPSATHGTKYTGAIVVSKSETVKAIAVEAGYTPSAVFSASFTIQ
jgi:hypothetical protein